MYELDAFKVTHVSKYPAPVLSVAISPNAALLAVGMADGQLSVRKHSHNKGPVGGGAPPQNFLISSFQTSPEYSLLHGLQCLSEPLHDCMSQVIPSATSAEGPCMVTKRKPI